MIELTAAVSNAPQNAVLLVSFVFIINVAIAPLIAITPKAKAMLSCKANARLTPARLNKVPIIIG